MTEIEHQIIETWHAHNRIMLFTIEHVPDDAMKATLSTRGGRDIARQFAHLHMVRVWHLAATNRKLAKGLIKFAKGATPSKKKLLEASSNRGQRLNNICSIVLRMQERLTASSAMLFRRSGILFRTKYIIAAALC